MQPNPGSVRTQLGAGLFDFEEARKTHDLDDMAEVARYIRTRCAPLLPVDWEPVRKGIMDKIPTRFVPESDEWTYELLNREIEYILRLAPDTGVYVYKEPDVQEAEGLGT